MATRTIANYFGTTDTALKQAIAESLVNPFHDVADDTFTSTSKQTVVAGTEYDFEANGQPYEAVNLPAHITALWDYDTNKVVVSELVDTPLVACRVQFNFMPDSAAAGYVEVKAYTDGQLFQTVRIAYKASDSRMEALVVFYAGSTEPYNIKENGVNFTYTASGNGKVYDRGILIYKT